MAFAYTFISKECTATVTSAFSLQDLGCIFPQSPWVSLSFHPGTFVLFYNHYYFSSYFSSSIEVAIGYLYFWSLVLLLMFALPFIFLLLYLSGLAGWCLTFYFMFDLLTFVINEFYWFICIILIHARNISLLPWSCLTLINYIRGSLSSSIQIPIQIPRVKQNTIKAQHSHCTLSEYNLHITWTKSCT